MLNLHSFARDQDQRPNSAWYAIYTRHQHEKTVAQALSGKGFEVFVPLYSAAHRWRDRLKWLSLPLFPGYVFLRTDFSRRLPVLTTPGVHHFVPHSDRPISIPDVELDAVRQLTLRNSGVQPHPFLKCGDRVRVKTGSLEGLEGILTRWKAGFRLVLSVNLLQQSVAVEVGSSSVEVVRKPWAHPRFSAPSLIENYGNC